MAQYSPYQPEQPSQYGPQNSQYPQYQQQFPQQYDTTQQYGQPNGQYQQYEQPYEQYQQYQQYQQQSFQQYESPQPVFATVKPAPTSVMQLALEQQLGELRATYAPRFSNPSLLLALIFVLIVVDVVLVFVLFKQLHAVNRLAFILVVLPIVGIIYTASALLHHSHRVYLFTTGMVYVRGQERDVLRWNQVSAVWHRLVRQPTGEITHRYSIQRYDGKPIRLGSITGDVLVHADELGSLIEHEVMQVLLPSALAAYTAGQILSFGKLSLSLQGIAHGKRTIPWNEVGLIEMQKDQLVISKGEGKAEKLSSVKSSDIPNFPLFLQIVAQATGQQL